MEYFLDPNRHNNVGHMHDPYTVAGARSIARRFSSDMKDMLYVMRENHDKYEAGKTMLSQSPLARKVWVAAAMKTLGLVEEHPTANGACALTLTEKALAQWDAIHRYY